MNEHVSLEVGDEITTAPTESQDGLAPPACKAVKRSSDDILASLPITKASLPNGKQIPLLKSMVTSVCERNCYYCSCRAGRDVQRTTFSPESLAKTIAQLERGGIIKGVFLSSGIAGGGIRTQDRIVETAEILRTKLGYRGYIHLKIMPGAERAQVEESLKWADRVSINLEAPTTQHLAQLAPMKQFMEELLTPLQWVEDIRQKQLHGRFWKDRCPSSTTQFVVGSGAETDLEYLQMTSFLFDRLSLARVFFSRFQPIKDTPLEDHPGTNPWRQHRLYQASYLLKYYPFEVEDMPFQPGGSLPLDRDPKLAWAQMHLIHQPIEINRASLEELMRIPGIGPKHARSIISRRRQDPIKNLEALKLLGIHVSRAAPFILLSGRRPARQLPLW